MPGGASRARPVGSGPEAKLEQASASVLVPEPSACGLRAGEPPTLDPASPSRPTQPREMRAELLSGELCPWNKSGCSHFQVGTVPDDCPYLEQVCRGHGALSLGA